MSRQRSATGGGHNKWRASMGWRVCAKCVHGLCWTPASLCSEKQTTVITLARQMWDQQRADNLCKTIQGGHIGSTDVGPAKSRQPVKNKPRRSRWLDRCRTSKEQTTCAKQSKVVTLARQMWDQQRADNLCKTIKSGHIFLTDVGPAKSRQPVQNKQR